ncbi:hypothetical protein [Piscinibacter gummiphilus]|uniref:Uncharacterized protein n=1 Tax=Piscinibacter gummiphilus TaxID=946333 RepID=A0A1W6L8H4_9BURK|nr:hypothetical protein [Piscinibacter gummiphilus]ARN20605.1 hypothetical protein A4W93_12270 [Piscinibacter gummiphilus]ATU65283.1 hypothetical protein CPZ87_12350 [Piscinibacter gummiphilus]GLS98304.1 hypothetical protein GCM10007918_55960 [Piscinibacter gummiphilus]
MSFVSFDALVPVAGAIAVSVVVLGVWGWRRATASRREERRRAADRAQRRARAEAWWRQHSLSTLPHSRFFESVLDDPPSIFASSRPGR